MVNSRVSRQWLFDKYAMKAVRVHGGGDEFDNISFNVGRFELELEGHEDECRGGTAIVIGRTDEASSPDMLLLSNSSSASQSPVVGLRDLEDDIEDVDEKVTDVFLLSMPLRKLFRFPTTALSFTSIGFGLEDSGREA